ncbi:MAG: hypothetical protein RIC95_05160 [Vicingaceae bacterium]
MKEILKYKTKQVIGFALGINLLTTLISYFTSDAGNFDWVESLVGDAFATKVITLAFYFYKRYHLKKQGR